MKSETENNVDASSSIQAGTMLKNKREELGLTQRQIADRLRLRVSIIEQIESNELQSQKVATFTRGYIRSYAKAVGLDEEEVLATLGELKDDAESSVEMQSFSRKTKVARHNNRLMLMTWGIFIIIAGISSLWWWQNQKENSLSQAVNNSVAEVPKVQEPESPVADADANKAPSAAQANNNASDEKATQEPQAQSAAAETEAGSADESAAAPQEPAASVVAQETTKQPESDLKQVTMTFSADCWVQIKDADGHTLTTGVRKAGKTLELSGKAPLSVILGAPEGVSMTFASEQVDLSRYNSGKVARFTLPLK